MTRATSPALLDQAEAMYATGNFTQKEVAAAIGINNHTLCSKFKERGVAFRQDVAVRRSSEKRTRTHFTACALCGHPTDKGQYCRGCGAMNARWRMIQVKYGLTPEGYADLLAKQDGRCALCREAKDYPLRVDHCHTTGRIRGLLCGRCNVALGSLGDDVAGLRRAIAYLEPAA